jgi:DNA-binding MarR family transcriptional regulator
VSRRRLGYLLKHAALRLSELTGSALEPYGVDGRELAVLGVIDSTEPLSQQEAAQRLRIDRTTMVALVDALEGKGLVGRRPHPGDRRKNMVELTDQGRSALEEGVRAAEEAEAKFLGRLSEEEARVLREMLDRLV